MYIEKGETAACIGSKLTLPTYLITFIATFNLQSLWLFVAVLFLVVPYVETKYTI